MENITRVALYIRVSSDEQVRDGYSLEAQREHLIKYAKDNHYKIIDIYEDDGITARKKMFKRKEFMRMIEDVKSDKIDLILFIKLDRWFRSVADYYKIQEILEKHNVSWKATQENYDTTTANGRLHVNIRLSVAQDEADRTSERIKFVFEKKVNDGEAITGKVPVGYKIENKKMIKDVEKIDFVKEVFEMYDKLHSKGAIVGYYNIEKGLKLCYTSLTSMLKNKMYIGEYRSNKNYCDPIISEELFYSVQDALKKNNFIKHSKKRNYLFTSLIFCPHCNYRMAGCISGNNSIYYRCNKKFSLKQCDYGKYINEMKLEQYLLDNIFNELKKYKIEFEASQKRNNEDTVKAKRQRTEDKIKRLKDLYVNGFIDIEDYKKDYESLNKELDSLKVKKTKKSIDNLLAILDDDFLNMYEKLYREDKALFWRKIIKKIIPLEDSKFEIEFN